MSSVSIIGAGYVGVVSAACLAQRDHNVIIADSDKNRIRALSNGKSTFYEPNLDDLLKKSERTLSFTTSTEAAVQASDMTFIAVGTPGLENGAIDLSQVRTAAREIGTALRAKRKKHLIVVRSTVVPGTTRNVVKPIIERASGLKLGAGFSLAMQPEFLREGKAVEDTFRPHCVIIGECDSSAGARLQNFYESFYSKPRPPILRMDCASAELVKYANNAFLAMKISMINEIANICERLPGTDVNTVAKAIGLDPRIGSHFLRAGAGFGGSCLPKDLRAITATARELGFEPILFPAILRANSRQGRRVAELATSLTKSLRGKRVSVLGLAFKSRTDDMREAPSLEIIERLKRAGATVVAYDPEAMPKARRLMHGVVFASSARQCLKGADLCIVLTEWEEFSTLTAKTLKKEMKKPALLDGRRIYRPEDFAKIPYAAIGLGPRTKSGREYPE